MSYSRNFGFRSFENIVRLGRQRTPKTGANILIGAPVVVDDSAPGFLRLAEAGEATSPGAGVLVYEHITVAGVGGFNGIDLALTSPSDPPFNVAPKGAYAQIVHGIGTKVWYRNTTDKPLYDARVQVGLTVVAGLGASPTIAIGDYLTPAGDGTWVEANGTTDGNWLYVEQVDAVSGRVECRFTF